MKYEQQKRGDDAVGGMVFLWAAPAHTLGTRAPCLPDSWAPLPAWAGVSPWPRGHRVQGFVDTHWRVPGIPGRRRRGGQTLQRQDANPGIPPAVLTQSGWGAPGSCGDWLAGCSDPAVPPAHAWPPGHTDGKDRCPRPAPQRQQCLAVAQGLGWLQAPWEPRGAGSVPEVRPTEFGAGVREPLAAGTPLSGL